MALEVLYGPVEVTVAGVPALHISGGEAWIQGMGLIMVLAPVGGSYGTYCVQMDGTAYPRSAASGYTAMLDLRSERGLAINISNDFYDFDWQACNAGTVPFLTGATSGAQVIASDRYLKFNGTDAYFSHDGVTYTSEYTFPGPASAGAVSWSRGRTSSEVCIACSSNTLRFYDVVKKSQTAPTLYIPENFYGAWYVPKHDVFILHTVGTGNGQLKILANATQPATLSDPTALTAITAGRVSQLQVQLLGSNSEPCVGERINWSITAGVGSLTAPQSTTDVNGYAVTGLIAPIGSSGSVTVGAELDF